MLSKGENWRSSGSITLVDKYFLLIGKDKWHTQGRLESNVVLVRA